MVICDSSWTRLRYLVKHSLVNCKGLCLACTEFRASERERAPRERVILHDVQGALQRAEDWQEDEGSASRSLVLGASRAFIVTFWGDFTTPLYRGQDCLTKVKIRVRPEWEVPSNSKAISTTQTVLSLLDLHTRQRGEICQSQPKLCCPDPSRKENLQLYQLILLERSLQKWLYS